jgi:hypothetical protein
MKQPSYLECFKHLIIKIVEFIGLLFLILTIWYLATNFFYL